MKLLIVFFTFALFSASSALTIHCAFNFASNWVTIGRVYTCEATILDATANTTSYEGEHLPGNSSADVRMIDFGLNSNCSLLSKIPTDLTSIFPNFIAIYFIECGINFLSGTELEYYPQLEWFGLYRSELERIPENFFKNTPRMKFINFNNNKIERVGENLLENLDDLERVYFNNNVCISKYATSSEGIDELIEALRMNCADVETTTVITTSTTDWCERGNSEERICVLEEENLALREEVESLKKRLERLEDLVIFTTTTPRTTTEWMTTVEG